MASKGRMLHYFIYSMKFFSIFCSFYSFFIIYFFNLIKFYHMYLCFQLRTCLVFSRYFIQCIRGGLLILLLRIIDMIIFASTDIIKTDLNLNGSHSNT